MSPVWSAALVAAAGYLVAVAWGRKGWPKVLPALLLAAYVGASSPLAAAAFAFCALGDAFLLVKERFFLHGLAAFLVGHALFIPTFLLRAAVAPPLWLAGAMGLFAVGVLAAVVPRLSGVLRLAVPIYALALAGMVVAAGALSPLAAAGAATFAVSDGVLAVNRFVRPFRGAEIVVMLTYYVAILTIGLALGPG